MKRFLIAFLSYSIFCSLAVFCFGVFYLPVPNVLPQSEFLYKISNGLLMLFDLLPSICFTAYMLGCSLLFGAYSASFEHRFDKKSFKVFGKVIVAAIAITFVVSMGTLVFSPFERTRQDGMKRLPITLNEYILMSSQAYAAGSYEQARKYIELAKSIDPDNEQVIKLIGDAEVALKMEETDKASSRVMNAQTEARGERFAMPDNSGMSGQEMLERARTLFRSGDFFGAHYFAVSASSFFEAGGKAQNGRQAQAGGVGVGSATAWETPSANPIPTTGREAPPPSAIAEAREIADNSWARLSAAQREGENEGNAFFKKKMTAYSALMAGDFLDAYYAFYDISKEDAKKERDADIVRYLRLAESRLLETYFFIDETFDLSAFENVGDIYFAYKRPQGGYEVVLIRGITEIKGSGGLIQYLRDLQVYSFDRRGNFYRSMRTPYAKMNAVDVNNLSEGIRSLYAPNPSTKMIPEIKLISLSRVSAGDKTLPTYNDTFGELTENQPPKMYLPMSYDDFSMIVQMFSGKANSSPIYSSRLAEKATEYGYSHEALALDLLYRFFYPFMILVTLIFLAVLSWNYRVEEGTIFKFVWIFVLPGLNALLYSLHRGIEYMIRLLDFVFIATTSIRLSFIVGGAVYLALLLLATLLLFARKRS